MQLLITSGLEAARAVSLVERGVLRVGREAECEVRLVDPTASRCHAELRVDGGRVWVKDAGSRFGTFVNRTKTVGHSEILNPRPSRTQSVPLKLTHYLLDP